MLISNKLVVVTGASSGIGAATAKLAAARGARVVCLGRSEKRLARVVAEITAEGGVAHCYAIDLADGDAVQYVAARIADEHGVPDVLVNNAGGGRFRFIDETRPGEVEDAMAVPYFAAFYLTRAFLPKMLRRNTGHIVNLTSPAAYLPWPGACSYGVARAAMRSFSEFLRADLHGTGLRVSLVCPGKTRTRYFVNNPGSEERIPGIARLFPTLDAEVVADAILTAVERERREVIVPRFLRYTVWLHRIAPELVEAVLFRTGFMRPAGPLPAPKLRPAVTHELS